MVVKHPAKNEPQWPGQTRPVWTDEQWAKTTAIHDECREYYAPSSGMHIPTETLEKTFAPVVKVNPRRKKAVKK